MGGPEGDRKERDPLEGRTVLITGGATGLGLETAKVLGEAGADLIIGTRSLDHFDAAQKDSDLALTSFIGDLTVKDEISIALDGLEKEPTDLILSAAGGMEDFSASLGMGLARIARKDPSEKKQALHDLAEKLDEQVEASLEVASQINFQANRNLVEQVVGRFGEVRVIFYSSIPSSFVGKGHIPPPFYSGVANSKGAFEKWMRVFGKNSSAPEMTIISGGIIEDSVVVKLITKYIAPMLSEEEQERLARAYIRNADMVKATLQVMNGEVDRGDDNPKTIYVVGKDKIVDEVVGDDPVFAFNSIDFAEMAERLSQ